MLKFLRNYWVSQVGNALSFGLMAGVATVGYVIPLQANGSAEQSLHPEWWAEREVVDEDQELQNLAPVNLGQLKWMTTQLYQELETLLPLGTDFKLHNTYSSEGQLHTHRGYFDPAPERMTPETMEVNNKVANMGQAKNIAQGFYDNLNKISKVWVKDQLMTNGLNESALESTNRNGVTGNYYPWTDAANDDANLAPINIGQLKVMFALRVRADGDEDGLPDLFEYALAGLSNLDYANFIGRAGDGGTVNPFSGKSLSEISGSPGDLKVSYREGAEWKKSRANTPFVGLANANASVAKLLTNHKPIGSVGGSFSVGGDGSASYSIPIDIPKGTSGMEPGVAIGYSSGGGNGALGVGFDLSGFQRITRGGTSRAKEGRYGVDPVDFDANDRFFFDGELLIAVDGAYGAHGTEYRTENDSFARIVSWGKLGSGPAFWSVETKAGLRIEMGNCSTSCIYDPAGKGALVWNVNKVSDNVGNYYEVDYDHESPAGTVGYRASAVHYTGNTRMGLEPYNHIYFDWEGRDDVTTGVICGVKVCNNKRLAGIRVEGPEGLLHRYEMYYGELSAQTRRSLLRKVQKHYPGETTPLLPATEFHWESRDEPVSEKVEESVDVLVYKGRQRWLGGETDDFNLPAWTVNGGETEYVKLIDLNGDGLLDRVSYVDPKKAHLNANARSYDDYGIWVALNIGSRFAEPVRWFQTAVNDSYPSDIRRYIASRVSYPAHYDYVGFYDVNADGLPDRVQFYDFDNENPYVNKVHHNGRGEREIKYDSGGDYIYRNGRSDSHMKRDLGVFAYTNPAHLGIHVALNTGSGFGEMKRWMSVAEFPMDRWNSRLYIEPVVASQSLLAWSDGGNDYSAFIDMNGDGIPDRVDHKNYATNEFGLWVSLGRGYYDEASKSGFSPKVRWYAPRNKDEEARITWANGEGEDAHIYSMLQDMNGDGLLDKVDHRDYADGGKYGLYVSLNTGVGFSSRKEWLSRAETTQDGPLFPQWGKHSRFLDVNGDGLPDRVDDYSYVHSQQGIWVRLNKGKIEGGSAFKKATKWKTTLRREHGHFVRLHNSSVVGSYQDMNGDGLLDRLELLDQSGYPRGLYVAINNGISGFEKYKKWFSSKYEVHDYVRLIDHEDLQAGFNDFNADGYPDRFDNKHPGTGEVGFFVALGNGKPIKTEDFKPWINGRKDAGNNERWWLHSASWIDGDRTKSSFQDLNGDGFPDRLEWNVPDPDFANDPAVIAYATAHKKAAETLAQSIARHRKGLWVSLNTGTGFQGGGVETYDPEDPPKFNVSELVHSIVDGLGAEIRMEYKRLNDPSPDDLGRSIYTREYPSAEEFAAEQQKRIIRAPGSRWAVSRYAEQDGLGGYRWTRNYYGGRKFDQANEVDLGFRWVETFDEIGQTGSVSIFSQEFPYQGNVAESLSYLKEGNEHILLERSYSYFDAKYFPYDGVFPRPRYTGGEIRFVHARQSFVNKYSYDTAVPGETLPVRVVVKTGVDNVVSARVFKGRRIIGGATANQSYNENGDLLVGFVDSYFSDAHSPASAERSKGVRSTNAYADAIKTKAVGFDHTKGHAAPMDSSKIFGKWILGRLTASTSVTETQGETRTRAVKTSRFTYYTDESGPNAHLCGMLKTEVAQPGHALALVMEKSYDGWGNMVGETSYPEGNPGAARWSITEYDQARGRFPVSVTNQLGHKSTSVYDQQRALLVSSTDANGLTASYHYDAYGTRILTRNPDGTETAEITATSGPVEGIVGITHKRVTQTSGSPEATVYLDGQGKTLLTEASSFSGAKVYARTEHDKQGRKVRSSAPYFSGEHIYWTTILYDHASRPWCTRAPDRSETKVYHNGFRSTLFNGKVNSPNHEDAQRQVRITDYQDRLVETIDNLGGSTKFTYNLQGNVIKTEAPGGHVIGVRYDAFGNKVWMDDSDTGEETTTYNAFGDPLTTTDAVGNQTTLTYDAAGRVRKKQTWRQGALESVTTTTYDSAKGAGLGKVHKTGVLWSRDNSSHNTEISYDRLGRAIRTQETRKLYDYATRKLQEESFSNSLSYDDFGRTRTETNAGGLTLLNSYNENGFANGLVDYQTGELYWKPLTYDSSGRLLTEELGNGVTNTTRYNQRNGTVIGLKATSSHGMLQDHGYSWDRIGNLNYRVDNRQSVYEEFEYDGLNRLTVYQANQFVYPPDGSTPTTKSGQRNTVAYNAAGNITRRSDRGDYTYQPGFSHRLGSVARYRSNTVRGLREYDYDANGAIIKEWRDDQLYRNITWGGHGKMTEVNHTEADQHSVDGGDGETLYEKAKSTKISFDYDGGINRIRQVVERRGGSDAYQDVVTTSYLGSYERIVHMGPSANNALNLSIARTEHRHHIGGFLVKTFTSEAGSTSQLAEKQVYQLKDHLGSVSALVGSDGKILKKGTKEQIFSYDAWGQRRNAQTWEGYRDSGRLTGKQRTSTETNRGYTGHEMLDEVALVHMNGRVYDAEIGRFLNADPNIQAPENSQNYNRYSYVLNNPLSYTDPSGYFFKKLFKAIGKFFKSVGKFFKKVGKWIKENWKTIVAIAFAFVAAFAFAPLLTLSGAPLTIGGFTAGTAFGLTGAAGAFSAVAGGAIAGALSGAFNAAINGGDLGDILKGAVVGALQGLAAGGVGSYANGIKDAFLKAAFQLAGHGVVGGVKNVVMGQKFGDGFLSAAVAKAFSISGLTERLASGAGALFGFDQSGASGVISRSIAAGVVGGTVSALSGGKFANGAYTAAFQHLLNEELTGKALEKAKRALEIKVVSHEDVSLLKLGTKIRKNSIASGASLYQKRSRLSRKGAVKYTVSFGLTDQAKEDGHSLSGYTVKIRYANGKTGGQYGALYNKGATQPVFEAPVTGNSRRIMLPGDIGDGGVRSVDHTNFHLNIHSGSTHAHIEVYYNKKHIVTQSHRIQRYP